MEYFSDPQLLQPGLELRPGGYEGDAGLPRGGQTERIPGDAPGLQRPHLHDPTEGQPDLSGPDCPAAPTS